METQEQHESKWNVNLLVVQTLLKMSDKRAEGNIEAYFSYFFDAFQMTMNYHPSETRIALEKDMQLFYKAKEELKTKYPNEGERLKHERLLMLDFADKHKFFPYAALSNMGIQKSEMEGEVDFGQLGIEKIAAIVRNNSGIQGSIAAAEKKDDKDGREKPA